MENLINMKITAKIKKLGLESDKLLMETRWYPLLLSSALIGAIAGVMKLLS